MTQPQHGPAERDEVSPAPLRLVQGPFKRTVVLIPEHDEPQEVEAPSNWDGRIRVGIMVALLVAAVTAGVAIGPLLVQRTARLWHADTVIGAPLPAAVSPSSEAVLRAAGQLDTLEVAVRAFSERRTDFYAQRIACPELVAGYVAADAALLRAALTVREDRDSLTSAVMTRYSRLLTGMDSINVTFDASGCGRP